MIKWVLISLGIAAAVWLIIKKVLGKEEVGSLVFYRMVDNKITTERIERMILKDNQQGQLAVMAVSKKGHPAQVEGTPAWLSSAPEIASVTPAADGLSATVKAEVNLGDAAINCSAQVMEDGNLVAKNKSITVSVVAGDASDISIIEGEITDQPV